MDALNGRNCEIQYGCEDALVIPADGTLGEAWQKHAADVGAEPGRSVTFRVGGKLISTSALLVPGNVYVAHIRWNCYGG